MPTKISKKRPLTVNVWFHWQSCSRLVARLLCWHCPRRLVSRCLVVRWDLFGSCTFTCNWIPFSCRDSWTCLGSSVIVTEVVGVVELSTGWSTRSCLARGARWLNCIAFCSLLDNLRLSGRDSLTKRVRIGLCILSYRDWVIPSSFRRGSHITRHAL